MSKKNIYFDYAATTPVDKKVLKAMQPYFFVKFGNASSLHQAGIEAKEALNDAQEMIAGFLGCRTDEVFFTSGATESDNWIIFSMVKHYQKHHAGKRPHIIVSSIEHDAILEPLRHLEKDSVDVTYLPVSSKGIVSAELVKKFIKPNTILVSIIYANNEIGTIQPIGAIAKLIAKENLRRKNNLIYFHTDATQAPAYLDCDVNRLGVDALSFSAHKIYGPKGIGVLYLKKGTPLLPMFYGGGQQNFKRAGTYNVAGIVGLAKAIELISDKNQKKEIARIKKLRDYLVRQIIKKIPLATLTGDPILRLPNNAHFIFRGVEGESVLLMLAQKRIAVSTGSACSSGSLEPSHVLLSMNIKPELAHGSIRVTLGRETTHQDVDALLRELPPIVDKLRRMSPLK